MIKLIKNSKYEYDAYWNESNKKWTGILSATMYKDESSIPEVENGQVVDYFETVGLTKTNA